MLRYVRIWIALAKNSIIRQLEYRGELLGGLSLELVWMASLFVFYKTLFSQRPTLGQWQESEMLFFAASLFFVDAVYMVFISKNSHRFPEIIRSGIFDFYLLRPISSLFMSTFRAINILGLLNIGVALLLIRESGVSLSPWQFGIWFIYCILGFLLLYFLLVIVCSVAFWVTQTSNLMWLFFELYRLGHRPDDIYVRWLQRVLFFVFPAAFFISVPVKLALGKIGGLWFLWPFLWTLIAAAIAGFIWRRGLKAYEGAMS